MKKLFTILLLLITSIGYSQTIDTVRIPIGGFGGGTDTTSLSNRINSKLAIADTANMLAPYASAIATNTTNIATNTSAITTLAPINNPVFTGTVKNGSDTLASKAYARSVGGSGSSGTVTSVTASTPLSITGTATITPNVVADTTNPTTGLATNYQINKKYDSTQFNLGTTFIDNLQTNSTGFANFNGGSLSYDATNKRLVVVTSYSQKGVVLTPTTVLTPGNRYMVTINANIGTCTSGMYIQNRYGGTIFAIPTSGVYNYTFVAGTADVYYYQTLYILANSAGTFYIYSLNIVQVPLNFDYATKGDVLPILQTYQPILNNTNALANILVNSSVVQLDGTASGPASISIGNLSSVTSTETGGIAIGNNSSVNAGLSGGGGEVALGQSALASGWRSLALGGFAQANAVSSTAVGYGSFVNVVHGQVYGRGGYNTLGGTLFYQDAGGTPYGHIWTFGSTDAYHTNPAMPGGESVDYSAGLNAGTLYSILRGYSGWDSRATPTLTNTRGGTIRLAGGTSTGTAPGGNVGLAVTPATGTSGNNMNPDSVVVLVSAQRQGVSIGNVGLGTRLPDTSAILDVQSNRGVLLSPMTTTTWNGIYSKADGLQAFDVTLDRPVWRISGSLNRYPMWTTDSLPAIQISGTIPLNKIAASNTILQRGIGHRGSAGNDTLFNYAHVATYTSASSININADTTDAVVVTALSTGLTLNTPTGIAYYDNQPLTIRIRDNGTTQTLTFGSGFEFSTDLPAPTGTTANKLLFMRFIRDNPDNVWLCVQKLDNFN